MPPTPRKTPGSTGSELSKLFEGASKISLKGGVVGKIITVLAMFSLSSGAVGMVTKNEWVQVLAIGVPALVIFALGWRLIGFAEKNPQAALYEGAELLVHERMKFSMKGALEIQPTTQISNPQLPIEIDDDAQSPESSKPAQI